jgi:hypothetical protein
MPSTEAETMQLEFQVPYECSVGVLHQALHREGALSPMQAEMEAKANSSALFEGCGVACVMLHAQVNARVGKRQVQPTGVVVDKNWRMLDKETYWAHVNVDLSEWTPKSRERSPQQALAGALPILAHAGWIGFAQAAVELGASRERVEAFLAGSPVSLDELQPRSKRRRSPVKPRQYLEVQVLFRANDPNAQLAERHRISEILARAAATGKLGSYEGSSSSDEHFEFTFAVPDREKAEAGFLAALGAGGVDSQAISFHTDP